ncbi:uncharacterized protein LOC111044585 [Nilaparvata lugens]|uniref:uncharacterized protein LOC111044585 n=1 Tax=Nilaparvata lugens TaxID=108931 RepID=UPI00193DA926|nr:uncharacterized protein LOC111044585 [Nilaparvata lugens]XP_039286168.1 uncharacterized protein LOC111044585 [Nilaparvata lugens]
MSGVKRRPCGPVRQLSLQTNSPSTNTFLSGGASLAARRCQLRKQSSEDIWHSGVTPPPFQARLDRPGPPRGRPPPVRIAWTEQRRKTETTEPSTSIHAPKVEVEVVARKCALPQARTRPPPKTASQQQQLDSSRLRLAERLRLAWQQSTTNTNAHTTNADTTNARARTNLDIFLAHNNPGSPPQVNQVTTTSEPDYSTEIAAQKYISVEGEQQLGKVENHGRDGMENGGEGDEVMRSRSFESRTEEGRNNNHEVEGKMMNNKEKEMKEGKSICISITDGMEEDGRRRCSVSELEDYDDDEEEEGDRVVEQRLKSSRNKNVVRGVSSLTSSPDLVVNKKVDSYPGTPSASRSSTPGGQPLPRRLMSAPAQSISKRPLSQQEKSSPQISQQARRKLKSARRKQQKPEEEDISSGEENIEQKPRRSRSARTSEVITMVSLLSPGQSEQEEDECVTMVLGATAADQQTPPWHQDGGTSNGVTNVNLVTSSPFQNGSTVNPILCIRKPVKTVSFQQQLGARSYANNFPSRRGAAILPEESHNPAPPVLRSTSLVAASAGAAKGGADLGAASLKRKLVRASSSKESTSAGLQPMTSNEDDGEKPSSTTSNFTPQIEIVLSPAKNTTKDSRIHLQVKEPIKMEKRSEKTEEEEEDEEENAENDIPEFKTPKEQECWDLFRRMVDKGITVSFETVLRGMLTPTEYRLRRHELLAS